MSKPWCRTLVSALALATIAQAQTVMSTVHGTVKEPGRKPVAGATVLLRNLQTGDTQTQTTSDKGEYRFKAVPTGNYEIVVTAEGLRTVTDSRVSVGAQDTVQANFRMAHASQGAVVTITAEDDQVTPTAAAKVAPSQSSLAARSAESIVAEQFIRDFTNPVSDYSQAIQMTPGVFAINTNGPGLGQASIYFRGFADGQYTMAFDGIPFQDTNSPTHHSWAFFPGSFVSGAVVDRSPGSAVNIGPANFGGSITLLSRTLDPEQHTNLDLSYGTWDTSVVGVEYDTGNFGTEGVSNLLINAQQMKSDGYQTQNGQKQDAFSAKYQYTVNSDTQVTAFASYIDLRNNTPSAKGPTRAQAAQFGDNYLLSNDPTQPNFFGFNFYHVVTDFEYVGITSNLDDGWKVDDKLYTYDYHNQEYYNSATKISATSAVDKVNGYRTTGNIFRMNHDGSAGIFRSGLWTELANTDRYQVPTSPLTWADAALPNFHETFSTQLIQPFLEYEWKATKNLRLTPGIKYSTYKQDFTQFPDNGKTVGSLNGAPYVKNSARYSDWLPSLDLHYQLQKRWSVYAQYAEGDTIPSTSVFDVTGSMVSTLPKPTLAKTLQAGTVYKGERWTLDFDVYHIKFDNTYSSFVDNNGNTSYYANGTSVTQGVEAESSLLLGAGFSLYVNATVGSSKYDSGLWVQNAPRDTESLGLYYMKYNWSVGLLGKRVGTMYNDNGSTHQAVQIDPFIMPNFFVNYTFIKPASWLKKLKLKLSVNNLDNSHAIVGVTPAATTTSVPAPGDTLTILAARSVTLSAGFVF